MSPPINLTVAQEDQTRQHANSGRYDKAETAHDAPPLSKGIARSIKLTGLRRVRARDNNSPAGVGVAQTYDRISTGTPKGLSVAWAIGNRGRYDGMRMESAIRGSDQDR